MEDIDLKNPVWKNLVLKKQQVNLNFLPAKILLSRLQLSVNSESSLQEQANAAKEIFQIYLKNKHLPNAIKDIALLLNK